MARGFLAPSGFGRQGADPLTLLRRELEQLFDDRAQELPPDRAHTGRLPAHDAPAVPGGSSQVQARFDDGVLTVTLPKSGTRQGVQRIEVSRAPSQTGAAAYGGDTKPH